MDEHGGGRKKRERLLRVLAYVRKENDAIPDYLPRGFMDDQQEVRAVLVELGSLLQTFKAWRLRHQVPKMWFNHGVRKSYDCKRQQGWS